MASGTLIPVDHFSRSREATDAGWAWTGWAADASTFIIEGLYWVVVQRGLIAASVRAAVPHMPVVPPQLQLAPTGALRPTAAAERAEDYDDAVAEEHGGAAHSPMQGSGAAWVHELSQDSNSRGVAEEPDGFASSSDGGGSAEIMSAFSSPPHEPWQGVGWFQGSTAADTASRTESSRGSEYAESVHPEYDSEDELPLTGENSLWLESSSDETGGHLSAVSSDGGGSAEIMSAFSSPPHEFWGGVGWFQGSTAADTASRTESSRGSEYAESVHPEYDSEDELPLTGENSLWLESSSDETGGHLSAVSSDGSEICGQSTTNLAHSSAAIDPSGSPLNLRSVGLSATAPTSTNVSKSSAQLGASAGAAAAGHSNRSTSESTATLIDQQARFAKGALPPKVVMELLRETASRSPSEWIVHERPRCVDDLVSIPGLLAPTLSCNRSPDGYTALSDRFPALPSSTGAFVGTTGSIATAVRRSSEQGSTAWQGLAKAPGTRLVDQ
eukprot:COSAG02_NODE_61_length_43452_cov_741.297804_5_plen_499_part_00